MGPEGVLMYTSELGRSCQDVKGHFGSCMGIRTGNHSWLIRGQNGHM